MSLSETESSSNNMEATVQPVTNGIVSSDQSKSPSESSKRDTLSSSDMASLARGQALQCGDTTITLSESSRKSPSKAVSPSAGAGDMSRRHSGSDKVKVKKVDSSDDVSSDDEGDFEGYEDITDVTLPEKQKLEKFERLYFSVLKQLEEKPVSIPKRKPSKKNPDSPDKTEQAKGTTEQAKVASEEDKRQMSSEDGRVETEKSIYVNRDYSSHSRTRNNCTVECRLALGIVPSLQCSSCQCLSHAVCVGFESPGEEEGTAEEVEEGPRRQYTCKNCAMETGKSNGPPKPSPDEVSCAIKDESSNLDPSEPMDSHPETNEASDAPVIHNSPKLELNPPPPSSRPQPIVGALTTWLPHSSSIQVSTPTSVTTSSVSTASSTTSSSSSASSEVFHQGLMSLGGNQYVIIPRHNVVNVSNHAHSSSTPSSSSVAAVASEQTTASGPPRTQVTNPHGILLVPVQQHMDSDHLQDVTASLSPDISTLSNGMKRPGALLDSHPPSKKLKVRELPVKANFMTTLNAGLGALLQSFQYLKVHELLRASCVSQMWHYLASHPILWETLKMKNSRVRDWEGFGKAIRKYNCKSLDLKKMLLPESSELVNDMWVQLSRALSAHSGIQKVDLGRCTSQAVELVASSCPQLESLVSLAVRGSEINLQNASLCRNLTELKLKSLGGIEVKNLTMLKDLTNLKTLALTTIKSLEGIDEILNPTLETLELGECTSLPENLATVTLPKLVNLKRLRLEKGQGPKCPTVDLLNAISTLPNLKQLELINFDVKAGFDKALAKCTNIKVFLIIPTYVTQSATTNHVVMGGVSKLSGTLKYFMWGLTLELLRVTDLFIEQVEGQKSSAPSKGGAAAGKKSAIGDSIPILKPLNEDGTETTREGQNASQVDILGLPKLQRVLSTLLPHTKIKILKVPFSATWRQTVSDAPSL